MCWQAILSPADKLVHVCLVATCPMSGYAFRPPTCSLCAKCFQVHGTVLAWQQQLIDHNALLFTKGIAALQPHMHPFRLCVAYHNDYEQQNHPAPTAFLMHVQSPTQCGVESTQQHILLAWVHKMAQLPEANTLQMIHAQSGAQVGQSKSHSKNQDRLCSLCKLFC